VRIGLIGDYNAKVRAHLAIPRALELAAEGRAVHPVWLFTRDLDRQELSGFDGLWCVPNSPYESMSNALSAIRYAREHNVPFLGTCGGFQHAIIEYARNVLALEEADHQESSPEAGMLLVSRLACSLVGVRQVIKLTAGSRAASIIGETTEDEFYCNFGLNPRFAPLFNGSGLEITGYDETGEPRVAELPAHRFFVCTLFQPELKAEKGIAHPLIRAYLDAVVATKMARASA
jgi:CTP synthase (UTP-ammonia lyase)